MYRGLGAMPLVLLISVMTMLSCAAPASNAGRPARSDQVAETAVPRAAPEQASATSVPSAGASSERHLVRAGLQAAASDAAIFVALERGYFDEVGIALEYENFSSASDMIPALSTGRIDVAGIGSTAATYNAFARGTGIRLVADKGSTPPGAGYMALVIRKDHVESGRFRGASDLRGMTIAVTPPRNGTANSVALGRMLAETGIADNEVSITNIPFSEMVSALGGRSVDAAYMIEPSIRAALHNELGVRWKGNDELYSGQQVGILGYSPELVRDRPAVARAFMVAYLRGARDYNDAFMKGDLVKRALVVAILTKHTSIKDPALFDTMVPAGINPNGWINLDSMEFDQQWFLDRGTVERPVDLRQLVDHQYVEYALRQLGEYR